MVGCLPNLLMRGGDRNEQERFFNSISSNSYLLSRIFAL